MGLLLIGPVGILVGPFAGATIGEVMAGRRGREAIRAGVGGVLGALSGTLLNFLAGLAMLGLVLSQVW
jgi:uncharacterized protein YqgC (DUF456 family)